MSLCQEFVKRIKEYDKPLGSVCKRIRFEDILDTIKSFFDSSFDDKNFSKNCSLIKSYFKNIRDWYAHGRYFKHVSPKYIPEPEDIKIIYNEFETYVFYRQK